MTRLASLLLPAGCCKHQLQESCHCQCRRPWIFSGFANKEHVSSPQSLWIREKHLLRLSHQWQSSRQSKPKRVCKKLNVWPDSLRATTSGLRDSHTSSPHQAWTKSFMVRPNLACSSVCFFFHLPCVNGVSFYSGKVGASKCVRGRHLTPSPSRCPPVMVSTWMLSQSLMRAQARLWEDDRGVTASLC